MTKIYTLDDCTCGVSDRTWRVCPLHGTDEHRKSAEHIDLTVSKPSVSVNKFEEAIKSIKDYALKYPYDISLYDHVIEVIAKLEVKPSSPDL